MFLYCIFSSFAFAVLIIVILFQIQFWKNLFEADSKLIVTFFLELVFGRTNFTSCSENHGTVPKFKFKEIFKKYSISLSCNSGCCYGSIRPILFCKTYNNGFDNCLWEVVIIIDVGILPADAEISKVSFSILMQVTRFQPFFELVYILELERKVLVVICQTW